MKTIVVTPTYNEAENLPVLIEEIFSLNIDDLGILVVDDNSPDGTGRIAEQLAQSYPHRVEVIHREGKRGLGTAYVTGFTRALEKGAEAIIEMDADLSHPADKIPEMIELSREHPVVVGSRYVGRRVNVKRHELPPHAITPSATRGTTTAPRKCPAQPRQ